MQNISILNDLKTFKDIFLSKKKNVIEKEKSYHELLIFLKENINNGNLLSELSDLNQEDRITQINEIEKILQQKEIVNNIINHIALSLPELNEMHTIYALDNNTAYADNTPEKIKKDIKERYLTKNTRNKNTLNIRQIDVNTLNRKELNYWKKVIYNSMIGKKYLPEIFKAISEIRLDLKNFKTLTTKQKIDTAKFLKAKKEIENQLTDIDNTPLKKLLDIESYIINSTENTANNIINYFNSNQDNFPNVIAVLNSNNEEYKKKILTSLFFKDLDNKKLKYCNYLKQKLNLKLSVNKGRISEIVNILIKYYENDKKESIMFESSLKNKFKILLQEVDKPEDFATPNPINQDDANINFSDTENTNFSTDDSMNFDLPEMDNSSSDMSFNDGDFLDYGPESDMQDQEQPAISMDEYQIIDVLVNEFDDSDIKVKLKNKESNKEIIKNLYDIYL